MEDGSSVKEVTNLSSGKDAACVVTGSPILPRGSKAVKRLIEIGLVPKLCSRFELTLDRNEAIQAVVTYFVTEEQMDAIANVFSENREEIPKIKRRTVIE
jgi:hypothetical protein